MCVIAVVGVAPCQCRSFGGHQITSPGRTSTFSWPSLCTQPQPAVTSSVCPSGCQCQAVRAPGSNVTLAPRTRAGSGASNNGSIRTVPVKYSAGPLFDGCDPLLLISMCERRVFGCHGNRSTAQLLNFSPSQLSWSLVTFLRS